MTTERPSAAEEVYFARQEAELRRVKALETRRRMEETERERLKALHYLRCPKCGMALETVTLQGVQIDRCHSCNGTWLDEGELEQLAVKEPGFLEKFLGVFRTG
jgi:ribosomal protein L37AE/L43A